MLGEGRVSELILMDGAAAARLACPAGMVPAPGQYLLAHALGSDAPLATALFAARAFSGGFLTASPVPSTWAPGTRLHLRGPLGHGFALPASARRLALVAFQCSPRALLSLLDSAAGVDAAVALVSDQIPDDLSLHVEAQPLSRMREVCRWADVIAFDARRDALEELKLLFQPDRNAIKAEAQVLVRTPMPCGALAACGVCTVEVGRQALLACEDGPVFDFRQLMGWSSRA
jgi:NAD(P)H-flavin reductase